MLLGPVSLRSKFLAIVALILIVATAAYLGLAVRLFNADKTAYIYDSNAALVETLGGEAATGVLSALKTMRLAALAVTTNVATARQGAVQALARDDDEFVGLRVLPVKDGKIAQEPVASYVNEAYLASYERDAGYTEALFKDFQPPLAVLTSEGLAFQNAVIEGGPPLLGLALAVRSASAPAEGLSLVVVAFLRQDRRLAIFQRSTRYATAMLDGAGNVLAHTDTGFVQRRETLAALPVVQDILRSPLAKGATEYLKADGSGVILAYKKIGIGNLVVLSEIGKDKAFLASRKLVEKSAQLAVLVLALAFLVSIAFSRRLTAALDRLYQATLQVAKGNFKIEVAVESKDEVGSLSLSFNRMAREIDRLVIETVDKARMEKELETAQLVQNNFFPKERLTVGPLEVSAFFKPASECGGDWWGGLTLPDKLVILIGDATGHGVPAALITAAAHSCAMTLSRLSERLDHAFPLTPAFILDSLNAAIYHAGRGRVKMTFFAAVIDRYTGKVCYANASHEMPFICRASQVEEGEPLTKAHLDSLAERPDACLGESLDTVFTEHEAELAARDVLILYTDGILECRNAEKEEYGERRFLKSLLACGGEEGDAIKDALVKGAMDFSGEGAPEDDVTLVVVKHRAEASGHRVAG